MTTTIELGPFRLTTDLTFNPPGTYPIGNRVLTKILPTAVAADDVGHIDAVLRSHDRHRDNLDHAGRAYLREAPQVMTTPTTAFRLDMAAKGIGCWEQVQVARPAASPLTLTAVPAQHGPDGTEQPTGPVTGFVLDSPSPRRVYISDDNASLDLAAEVAEQSGRSVSPQSMPVSHALPCLVTPPHPRQPLHRGGCPTLGHAGRRPSVIPGWDHYSEGADTLRSAFAEARLDSRLVVLEPGERAVANRGQIFIVPGA
jgi:hypothetical protein